MQPGLAMDSIKIPAAKEFVQNAQKVIIGKDREVQLALICLISNGHLLIEDLPGMGKTTFVMLIAKLAGLRLQRIQFTNDLLPADILGTHIYDTTKSSFQFQPGPIFSEVVLGDELNRATPKTQSAFLQAMEEHKVSIDGKTYPLPEPFFLIATQNPIQQVGTFPLPESQLDRFMMRLRMNFPDRASEKKMLMESNQRPTIEEINPVLDKSVLADWQKSALQIHASEKLVEYVQDLLTHSRQSMALKSGLSPRAGLLLIKAARACAFLQGRNMVIPEDIQFVAPHVIAHRLNVHSDHMAQELIATVPVP